MVWNWKIPQKMLCSRHSRHWMEEVQVSKSKKQLFKICISFDALQVSSHQNCLSFKLGNKLSAYSKATHVANDTTPHHTCVRRSVLRTSTNDYFCNEIVVVRASKQASVLYSFRSTADMIYVMSIDTPATRYEKYRPQHVRTNLLLRLISFEETKIIPVV